MNDITIRDMKRPELDLALDWAAKEGWNPGLHDAEAFWAADNDGFLVAERNDQIVATGAVVSYDAKFGFMGLFIVRPDCRKKGLGKYFWQMRVKLLRDRILPDAAIGLDGVMAMVPFYQKGGFQAAGVDRRFEGRGERLTPSPDITIMPAARVPFANIAAYDAEHFPTARPRFLAQWLKMPGSAAFVATPRGPSGKLGGFAVVRKCRTGFKIGPLFAKDDATAEALFVSCSNHALNQALFLDVPDGNPGALALAAKYKMKEVFACARMYHGTPPKYNTAEVYGVTTLELG